MKGLEVLGLVGVGESGRVFAARDESWNILTVKVFEGMAVNRALLSRMLARLEKGAGRRVWRRSILWISKEGRRAGCCRYTAKRLARGKAQPKYPRSLQHRLCEHPGEDTWGLVRGIGEALGGMYARRVAHGNLKPGNIFLWRMAERASPIRPWEICRASPTSISPTRCFTNGRSSSLIRAAPSRRGLAGRGRRGRGGTTSR